MDLEGFEPIKEFEEYLIHRDGRVWSTKGRGGLLKIWLGNTGYYTLGLYKDSKTYYKSLHRLLMLQFVPNPLNLCCVNHINEIKTDNRLENLEWTTQGDNVRHSSLGDKNHMAKPKNYYETYATLRGTFKRVCRNRGWEPSSFEEIYSGEVMICKIRKYYYLGHDKYEFQAVTRDSFKRHCKIYKLNLNSFEEVASEESQPTKKKKYYYKEMETASYV